MSHSKSFIIVLLATLFACTQNNITIVKNNQTDYEIVVPENADTTVVKAANQFQYYLEKISGVQIPVTGETKADAKRTRFLLVAKQMKSRRHIQF
jgi:transcription antitermination factor NusA-like protein